MRIFAPNPNDTKARRTAAAMLIAALSGLLCTGEQASAATQYCAVRKPFSFDFTTFTTTLALPVKDQVETVRMSEQIMRERLARASKDITVEPLAVALENNAAQIASVAEKIARSGKAEALANYFRQKLSGPQPAKDDDDNATVEINKDAFPLIDVSAFADLYSKPHHNLTINTKSLMRNEELRHEFMGQIRSYFTKNERTQLMNKILRGEQISVNTELLPEFPRKMLKKFVAYRGPNCFHAALAFQSPRFTSSSLINVKDELGYHRAMINYDELWRALGMAFYEVNPDKEPLKYGDMVVFFDVPPEVENDLHTAVDFHWIRHTATYLFGGYTFSKGSKSPNTPYTVRTLAEEWRAWKHYTKNLGVKIYRRSLSTVKAAPPVDLTDWVY